MTLQKTIENDLQNTIENDLDFGVPKPLKTIKNAKTPKTSILPPLVDLAHRILKEICVCLRRFICFFSPKPYIYIYIYSIYTPRSPLPGSSNRPGKAKNGHFYRFFTIFHVLTGFRKARNGDFIVFYRFWGRKSMKTLTVPNAPFNGFRPIWLYRI